MSKKKAFSGSTMTLKDFHGGSIPSDLPLPSAPGVAPRAMDRGAYERPMGGGLGRQDYHRTRPGSAGGISGGTVRGLEDGAPFLARIGRNFDEDERKPFDASSAPRRAAPMPDDSRSTRSIETRVQIHQYTSTSARPGSSPAVQATPQTYPSFSGSSSTAVVGNFNISPSQPHGSSNVNAWGIKKEETIAPTTATLSSPVAASRFAQASAIDKVTSGRWQSKHGMINQNLESEINPAAESGGGDLRFKDGDAVSLRRCGERANFDRLCIEKKEMRSDGARPMSAEGRLISQQIQRKEIAEVSERMKLSSFSLSTKPVEPVETLAPERRQVYRPPVEESLTEVLGNSNQMKPKSPAERPKLNLLPRSQQGQLSDEFYSKREKVFGGARPREVVLKERGVDDASLPVEPHHLPHNRDETWAESKKDQLQETEKPELQRSSRWTDSRKSTREPEKPVMGRAETRSWRRPGDPSSPKSVPDSTVAVAQRFGKAASALELAQAFSKPNASAVAAPQFSRLAAPPPEMYSGGGRRHININGY